MSLGVGSTKDEVICILAQQLTEVAAMANALSHCFVLMLMVCILRMVAVLTMRNCDESLGTVVDHFSVLSYGMWWTALLYITISIIL